MTAERDYRTEEIRQLKDALKLVDAEYAIEMEVLGNTMAAESLASSASRRSTSLKRNPLVVEPGDHSFSKSRKRSQGELQGADQPSTMRSHQYTDDCTSKSASDTRAMGHFKRMTRGHDNDDVETAKRDFTLLKSGGRPSIDRGNDTSLNADEIGSSDHTFAFSGINEAPSGSPALYENLGNGKRGEFLKSQDREIREVRPVKASISGSSQRRRPQDRDQSVNATSAVSAVNNDKKFADAKQRTRKEKPKRSA